LQEFDCGWGSRRAVLSSLERRDRQFAEALRDGPQVVLWFEHDLYDQLQLLDALALAHPVGGFPEVIVVGSFPGKPSFGGLGELTAEELETLWPTRRTTTPEALDAAASAWDAFRATEPTALAEYAEHGSPQLPFLAPALQRLLEELPAPADGLSGTERRALQAIAADARTPQSAFVACRGRKSRFAVMVRLLAPQPKISSNGSENLASPSCTRNRTPCSRSSTARLRAC
jgi:hypothetical protein